MCVSSLSVCLQTRQQDLSQQQSQASRLDQLELQLQSLAAKTEVQQHFIIIIIIIVSFSDSQKLQSLLISGLFGSAGGSVETRSCSLTFINTSCCCQVIFLLTLLFTLHSQLQFGCRSALFVLHTDNRCETL